MSKEYNQSDLNIDHLVMSICRIFSCVVGRWCLLWPVHSLGKTLLALRHHKTPRREHRQNILWHKLDRYFLRPVSQGNRNKSKNKQMGPNHTYKLFYSKGSHNKEKGQLTEWEKIFANDATDKSWIYKVFKHDKKTNKPIKKWAEYLNRYFSREGMLLLLSRFSRVRLCRTP